MAVPSLVTTSRGSCAFLQHRVVGGSNFNTTYDPVRLREATCSNLEPQADSQFCHSHAMRESSLIVWPVRIELLASYGVQGQLR